MSIIDAHTHVFPPWVIAERERYCARDAWFNLLYANPGAQLAAPEDLLLSMQAGGIARAVICGFPWADPGLCREHTAWMAEVCRTWPAQLAFLAIVVPQHSDAPADVRTARDLGAAGIGELNADAQGFDLSAPETLADFMEACRDVALPLMLHASEPLGHQYAGKGSAIPEKLVTFLGACAQQPVVLAHWGGGLPFYELMPEVHAVTANVCYDSAASTYLYRHAVIETVLRIVGPERVLFASDYPVLSQARLARRFEQRLPDEQERTLVMAGNAARVYRLQEGDAR